ncbi:hypothetical protein Tco_0521608, partial [Tanacetum coccineum]
HADSYITATSSILAERPGDITGGTRITIYAVLWRMETNVDEVHSCSDVDGATVWGDSGVLVLTGSLKVSDLVSIPSK